MFNFEPDCFRGKAKSENCTKYERQLMFNPPMISIIRIFDNESRYLHDLIIEFIE